MARKNERDFAARQRLVCYWFCKDSFKETVKVWCLKKKAKRRAWRDKTVRSVLAFQVAEKSNVKSGRNRKVVGSEDRTSVTTCMRKNHLVCYHMPCTCNGQLDSYILLSGV